MPAKWRPSGATALADFLPDLLDPVLQKQAGYNLALLGAWDDIVGPDLAGQTTPMKVSWPKHVSRSDRFEPATLTIACAPAAAFRIQHESDALIARVNGFLGYGAIGRVRIVQRAGPLPAKKSAIRPGPSDEEVAQSRRLAGNVEDEDLREALARLGASVKAENRHRKT